MEITDIKTQLTLATVLHHYNLKPDKNLRLHCPFHEDKTPSLQVYYKTHTAYCFSSNCKTHGKSLDVIDFIMYKENYTKAEAIAKAIELLGVANKTPENNPSSTLPKTSGQALKPIVGRETILQNMFTYFKNAVYNSKPAQEYIKQRGLDATKIEVGYNTGQFHHGTRKEETLINNCVATGLLSPWGTNSRKPEEQAYKPFGKYCIVFALRNIANQVTGLYFRSTVNEDQAKHYYLKDRSGLYPHYPKLDTKTLILTEAIIDAATLLQLRMTNEKLREHEVLACYGTNGLTPEHITAICQWADTATSFQGAKEIIFAFDNDQSGNKATEKYSKELKELLPHITLSKLELPENEDINSVYLAHEPEMFTHLLENRIFLSNDFSNEKKNHQAFESPVQTQNFASQLNTANPDKIIYQAELLKIEIWGGIEYGNMHRLRLSLYLENKATNRSFRDDVNLYSNRSGKSFIQDASEELEIPQSQLKETINQFTREVEEYRLKQKASHKDTSKKAIEKLSLQEQKEALQILKSPNLVSQLKSAMLKVGLIGETENGLLLFLIFLTRYFATPLHALVHGSTGSGKTNLLKSILKLVPPESKYETTALTENVLFRPPYKDFWKNKILLIEDLDGSYKALLPLREFMTNQYISKLANDPNPKTGKYEQVTLEAVGPIVIAGATTKDRLYEDNSNRSFLLHVNESKTHEDKVLDYQNKEAAGLIDTEGIQMTAKKIQNIQRMLEPNIKVINPFQPQLKLPEYVFTKKRTNTHYITLIKSITFLYQHQREKKERRTSSGVEVYIETTLQDVELANRLSKESLLRKSDELSGQVREFFERLKNTVQEERRETFLSKDIRSKLRMHPMKFSRYVNELRNRGYVKQVGGKERGSYEYQITVWDDYQILKNGLTIMDKILEKLYQQYPDGIYKLSPKTEERGNNSYYLGNNTEGLKEEVSLNQSII